MGKKVKLKFKTVPEGNRLRIVALKNFGDIKKGQSGGLIEKEENLSQEGDAWVYGNACIYEDAWVYGNAWVSENARVFGKAWVSGDACIYGSAWVSGKAWVYGSARVSGNTCISGNTRVYGSACISGNAQVEDHVFSGTGLFSWTNLSDGLFIGCKKLPIEEWEALLPSLYEEYPEKWVDMLKILLEACKVDNSARKGARR
jgi:hypothetical protein